MSTTKTLRSIEPFTANPQKNARFCIHCGQVATKIAYYNIEGPVILEKYCDVCVKAIGDSSKLSIPA
jgi:hypothetical protein